MPGILRASSQQSFSSKWHGREKHSTQPKGGLLRKRVMRSSGGGALPPLSVRGPGKIMDQL